MGSGGAKWGHVLLQDGGVVSVTLVRLGSVRVAWRVRLTHGQLLFWIGGGCLSYAG